MSWFSSTCPRTSSSSDWPRARSIFRTPRPGRCDNFFRPNNLVALRELALRRAAERIDSDLLERMQGSRVEGPWAAGERVLVCVGADSPRLHGEDLEHIRSLAELADELPPILVQRKTMRVIDGMHRLKAAVLRGERTIEAIFYDGDDAEAFVLAVRSNVQHGLPLTLSDRKAAAARIVILNPHWSDRAIAEVSGLSAKTVATVRSDAADLLPEDSRRIGRDGRSGHSAPSTGVGWRAS